MSRPPDTTTTCPYELGDELPLDAVTRTLGLDNASGAKAYVVSAKRKLARAVKRIAARGGRL